MCLSIQSLCSLPLCLTAPGNRSHQAVFLGCWPGFYPPFHLLILYLKTSRFNQAQSNWPDIPYPFFDSLTATKCTEGVHMPHLAPNPMVASETNSEEPVTLTRSHRVDLRPYSSTVSV